MNRETAFIYSKASKNPNAILQRNLKCHNVQSLKFFLDRFKVIERQVNMYYSLGKYRRGVPYRVPNNPEKDFEITDDWKKNHWREMISYDFFIDIDAKKDEEFKWSLMSAKIIKQEMDNKSYTYEMRFSGRGFHFVIPYDNFKSDLGFEPFTNNIYRWYYALAKHLQEEYSEMIDLRVYDARRVVKVPYSLSFYDDGVFVCRPVSSLEKFRREDYLLEKMENLL